MEDLLNTMCSGNRHGTFYKGIALFMDTEQLVTVAKNALDDTKGIDIIVIDVREKTSVADIMLICTGNSVRHVKALADQVSVQSKRAGVEPLGIEGKNQSGWMLVDLGDVLVHVMTQKTRAFYNLEELWSVVGADDFAGQPAIGPMRPVVRA